MDSNSIENMTYDLKTINSIGVLAAAGDTSMLLVGPGKYRCDALVKK
jgi:hypothetical protein